jgi:N12 class adenine-specific DNA methylase
VASKFQIITELGKRTAQNITDNHITWTSFLSTAAWNYKYKFQEQLLIHAQKPNATACAPIEVWNNLGRWVNKGARGIALIDDTNNFFKLRHVFDISDTNSKRDNVIQQWEMDDRYSGNVIEALENSFGDLLDKHSFVSALISTAYNAVEDNYSDYLANLMVVRTGSSLDEISEQNVGLELKIALQCSVSYILLTRCGIDANAYYGFEDFRFVLDFSTPETVAVLGDATSDIAKMALREIYETIKNIQTTEKTQDHTFAEKERTGYHENESKTKERMSENEQRNLYNARGLSTSRPDHSSNSNDREVRDASQDILENLQERDLRWDDDFRETDEPSDRDGQDGERSDGADGVADGSSSRRDGTLESDRTDEVGRDDEQHPEFSGGKSPQRAHLQLEYYDREMEDKSLPFFHSDKYINEILKTTPHLKATKQEIVAFFNSHEQPEDRIGYMKSIFNNDYTELTIDEDHRVGYKTFQNVLHLWEGSYNSRTSQGYYDWSVIANYFQGMILLHQLSDTMNPLPSTQQQLLLMDQIAESGQTTKKPAAFSFSQEIIDYTLQRGSGTVDGKYRIYQQIEKRQSASLNERFLSHEYGIGGASPILSGTSISEWHDGKGITIAKDNEKLTLSWSKVAKRIGELIAAERYLNTKEKGYYPIFLQRQEEKRQQSEEDRIARGILSTSPMDRTDEDELDEGVESEFVHQKEEPEKVETYTKYEFHLGDTIYFGACEYEVLSYDNNTVKLFDLNCPLMTTELQRTDFDRYIRENALNEHLKADKTKKSYEAKEQPVIEPIAIKTIVEQLIPDPITNLVGKVIEIDTREFCIDSIDEEFNKVSLRDITFQNGVGFPIFRSENLDFVKELLAQKQNVPITPTWDKLKVKARVQSFELHPEIAITERNNFHIVNDELGVGGAKEKFLHNLVAITLLKQLENENRYATPAEQETLSKYVGFGGLSQTFDEKNNSWTNEYTQLKAILDEDEYSSARESTLTSFYTAPVVIRAMYKAIENMGFKTGNILEPSCGTGNFLGMLPDSMGTSKMYGVELDSITGRIAQQLYQKSSIAVQGFEKTNLPDSFFDLAIGNVPFGQFKVADKRYDKNNFLIHDYFFAKTLDKVRPGGIVAFITSKGTLDKENPMVRKYIAQRADLLGAIRLPNNAFKANAGTEVTADIIFLQKRDRIIDIAPDWVYLSKDANDISMNSYFVENPDMIIGEMVMASTQYGMDSTCQTYENADLESMLNDAIANIHAEVTEFEYEDAIEKEDKSIPADFNVRNFSFTLVDGKLYFRENSRMNPINEAITAENRIKSMIEIRDCVRTLIEYQTEDYSDSDIQREQQKLNRLYDTFTSKYGLINSRANNSSFSEDSSYCLLCSLEVIDENGEFVSKADMFTKRTIKQHISITCVDTSSEALAVSIGEKACVDMEFMKQLTGKSQVDIENDLAGVVFRNPTKSTDTEPYFEAADEYLSGNVREKLKIAKQFAATQPDIYSVNVKALEAIQPKDLTASEISVRLGATWISPEIICEFIFDLLETPRYLQWDMKVHYSSLTSEWNIEGKSRDRSNIKANNTYGTNRINGYKIIEESLNLKDVRIFDYIEAPDGKKQQILNKKETTIAQQKQELIKEQFADWVWKDPKRREYLCRLYNDKFNSLRPREYDGSHIKFGGINPEIILRPHQVDAVAHIMYGGNTLLAHVVGAGKTFEMVAAAMESKKLGLCQKSLFVVPNHLTEQWSAEFLQLYPSANILVATKKDFETKSRKKFCGRIATGDYDAVIIGHSQFERIPMSIQRQQAILQQQLYEITDGISELKHNRGENFSIKQMEKTKKTIALKLDKLNDQSRKDDVVTFEELGIDRLFIDEAHFYKNLFLYTKMRNVGGIAQTEAQKSSDLFMKCRYLDEITGGRGIVFATGTPISNSMTELYTMQRYLQYNTLTRNGLQHFDSWASTFGETVTAIELAPEGTGYRAKTRFAKFYNLPELMAMFKDVADIQTADMLNLPIPNPSYHNVVIKPSEHQKEMVLSLSDRAEKVRNKMVDSSVDNMLVITNDGRKLALDQRLANEMLPDHETSKVAICANNIFDVWERTMDKTSAQMVFCDLSTPHYDGSFNVYDDIKNKLKEKGISENEIAFIHDANTEIQKKELFGKVRNGQIRVLIGSTQKMGSGTNVQHKLVALHDLDCPWRPSDLEQRSGRILRQGNTNPEVEIFRYVTEQTFDAYLYQLVENKQKFISQIMTSKSPVRSAEDIDETALSYAEIKALATGNPFIKEKMNLDTDVARLKLLKANYLSQRYSLEDQIIKDFPRQIKSTEERIRGYKADMNHLMANSKPNEDKFSLMMIDGITYADKAEAGKAILEECKRMTNPDPKNIGKYRGFSMELLFDSFSREYKITLKNELSHTAGLGTDTFGNITRLDNVLEGFETKLQACEEMLGNTKTQLENAKIEVERPFAQEEDLKKKSARLDELNILLNMDKRENEIVEDEMEEIVEEVMVKNKDYER